MKQTVLTLLATVTTSIMTCSYTSASTINEDIVNVNKNNTINIGNDYSLMYTIVKDEFNITLYHDAKLGMLNIYIPKFEANMTLKTPTNTILFETEFNESKGIDMNNYVSGTYILELKKEENIYSYKIVK